MKYMSWSYSDLMECPADCLPFVYEMMEQEAEANRKATRRR